MLIKATQKNTRQTPRKVRLVANTVKKLPLDQALRQLAVIERRSSLVILKTLKQAMANAINNHGFKFDDLMLDNILITEGPRFRRFRAASRGRAHGIIKRSSHITVTLKTREADKAVKPGETTTPAPKAEVVPAKTEAAQPKKAPKTAKKTSTKKVAKK
jgi:large subunit ribosomal protein L22